MKTKYYIFILTTCFGQLTIIGVSSQNLAIRWTERKHNSRAVGPHKARIILTNSIHEEVKSRLKSGNACYHSAQNPFVFQFVIQKYKH